MDKKSILIAGGTGLIGSRITKLIPENQFVIHILTRNKKPDEKNIKYFEWDIKKQKIDLESLKVDYIINLTGAGIADKRWTESRKKIIIQSRVESLQLLAQGLKKLNHSPKAISCASAIGFYGDRGNETLTESSTAGQGFLSESCIQWEEASKQLIKLADRGSMFRIGIVLSTKGGALPKILMTSKVGVLNYFGSGDQFYSYIHIDDLSNLFIQSLINSDYNGTYNAVSPFPVSNKNFVKKIAEVIPGYQMTLPVPSIMLKLALGEMASVVLDSAKVIPEKISSIPFEYNFPQLEEAIKDLYNRKV